MYVVRSFKLRDVINWGYDIQLSREEERQYQIKESDTALFRMVRRITGDERKYNPYIVFVDCGGVSDYADAMRHLVFEGITINGHRFVFGERSASMTRRGIVSFVDADISDEVERRIRMDIHMDKTVLSKWYAYRGLFFSSCHNLEGFTPKTIVVPDYMVTIPAQRIKYVVDNKLTFTGDDGKEIEYLQKNVAEDVRDITINAFDGCGICHPEIAREITERIGEKYPITSMIVRAPYIKGCVHAVDYETFYAERDVDFVQDLWGRWHDVHAEPMMIIGESMYKGLKYFKTYGDSRDWDLYWDKFDEYDHCWGVAKYNFSFEQEPVYTRGNYQILQDLDMPYEKFRSLADYTMRWLNDVIENDDPFYTECLLGLNGDSMHPVSAYAKAVAANPAMAKEKTVRGYIVNTVSKYIDDAKCGKLYLRGSFKLLSPDLIAFMEHVGGLPVRGFLAADEFYAAKADGCETGERLVERNPHLSASEHVILRGSDSEIGNRYFSHLANVCMINVKSIVPQRLNGADWDGDLALLLDEPDMMEGVRRDLPSVIDVEDKITALSEEDTPEGRYALTLRTMKSLIGEYSNYASVYHNKCPQTAEQKQKYMDYVSIISVITGKAIDQVKCGVIFYMPKFISKYGRPLPWFMRYRSEYYARQKLSRAPSNMNRLCWDIERWEKRIRWRRTYKDFDYRIMLNEDVRGTQDVEDAIDTVYAEFCKEMRELAFDQTRIRRQEGTDGVSAYDAAHFVVDWGYYYEKYKQRCREICPDPSLLANICVRLHYEKHPTWNAKFMWIVAEEGLLANIHREEFVNLPVRDANGPYTYLGRRYSMLPVVPDGAVLDEISEEDMFNWKDDLID